jgi:hypothetical protein
MGVWPRGSGVINGHINIEMLISAIQVSPEIYTGKQYGDTFNLTQAIFVSR